MILWIAAAFTAFFVKGLCGFANTLVFNTILSFAGSNISISPVELVLGYPSNIILVVRERKKLDPSIFLPVTAMVMGGSLAGIFLLKNADVRAVKIAFGFVVILTGLEILFRKKIQQPAEEKEKDRVLTPGILFFGILSGVLCGLYGVGALLGAYIGRVTKGSSAFKANICAVFLAENTFRLIMYTLTGILTKGALIMAVKLVPFMLAGLFCGIKAGDYLSEKTAVRLIMITLIISGAALILTNL